MDPIANTIKQRLSLREPLAEALDRTARLVDKLSLKKPAADEVENDGFLKEELKAIQEICPICKDFERAFPSFAFSIATGVGKTRLMGACIAYLYLKKGIRHFFVLAPNLTLYEKLIRDFGDPSYEKYVFKGLAEFVHNTPSVITGDNYNSARGLFSDTEIQINVFNISKFNADSKEGSKKGVPRMRRLSEYLGQSYFDYLASLDDLVILMDEAHRYHADASKKAINELRPILGLEMTATPTDEKGKAFKNIVYEYNLAQALMDGKYVKIPTVARRKNFAWSDLSNEELDMLKIEDAINIHERTKIQLELYAKNNNLPVVKPLILIVCQYVANATRVFNLLENDLFDGRYKGKVLQVDSSTTKDEEVERLFVSLEKTDNPIEIVIHVNKLKEGWDVTNLYTIVPLRAANAPILIEQSIGRGLRLPYGKRTGDPDVDKLTVIAHENFEAVIAQANDPKSILSRFAYSELDDEELQPEPGTVVAAQTQLDLQEQKIIAAAKTDIEKQEAKVTADAIRAVFQAIPLANTQVKCKADLAKPEVKEYIKRQAIRIIRESAQTTEPLFAEQVAEERIKEVDAVLDTVTETFVNNIIEIPRMTIQKEVYQAEFQWFDLDTRLGFDLPALQEEIIRISIGAGEKIVDTIQVRYERKFDKPINQIISALIDYDDIDYDKHSELLYHLAQQALDTIGAHLERKEDLAKVVFEFKKAIASRIYAQMKDHFVMVSTGYVKPKVLPYVGMVEQHLKENDGFGRVDYRNIIKPAYVRKYIYSGYLKSFYSEYKFDSTTELDFSFVLENDVDVIRWLRPAEKQLHIYWSNGSRRYEPDFIVETEDCIYMVETKAAKDVSSDEVLLKKQAAEEYCRHATEYTTENGGKPWKYVLMTHDTVDRSASFKFLIAIS